MYCWEYVECLVRLLVDHDYYYVAVADVAVDVAVVYLMLTIVIVIGRNYYQLQNDEIIEKILVMVLHQTNHHDRRDQTLVTALIEHFLLNLEFDQAFGFHQQQHLLMVLVVSLYLHWMVMVMMKMRKQQQVVVVVLQLRRVRKVVLVQFLPVDCCWQEGDPLHRRP